MNIFGKRLADLRKERDLLQTDIAGYLGMSRSGIQGYETEGKEPSYDTLCRIANYFDVSTDYLLGRSDERRKPSPQNQPGSALYDVRISCLRYGVVRVCARNEEAAKELADMAYRRNGVTWVDSEITDLLPEEVEERTYTVTEFCPHCETEVSMRWNTDTQGFKAFCPSCGQRLMLCDECHQIGGGCDYDSETDSCKFNPAKEVYNEHLDGI